MARKRTEVDVNIMDIDRGGSRRKWQRILMFRHNMENYRTMCHNRSMMVAQKEPADPFIYNRLMSQCRQGIIEMEDIR